MLHAEDVLYRLRFVLFGTLVFTCVLVLIILVVGVGAGTVKAFSTSPTNSGQIYVEPDSPNAVLGGLSSAAADLNQTMSRTGRSISDTTHATAMTTLHGFGAIASGVGHSVFFGVRTVGVGLWFSVRTVGFGVAAVGHGIGASLSFVGSSVGHGSMFLLRTVGSSAAAVSRVPGKIMGLASHPLTVSSIIQPIDHTPVPTIEGNSPVVFAAQKAMATAQTANPAKPIKPQWPLHGVITTLFGVPELPFQAVHTGIDISDGRAPGLTPVHPFRPGKVISIIHSSFGLGNHVIIDHGSGVTSVYGHLDSISVHQGQKVDGHTLVGYEGTTGASTGTHLHFEIRIKGQAVDPHRFIPGQP